MSKITYVDSEECTSCALCTDGLPNYFKMDDDDLAVAIGGPEENTAEVADGDIDKVQEMIDDCPAECIHWKE